MLCRDAQGTGAIAREDRGLANPRKAVTGALLTTAPRRYCVMPSVDKHRRRCSDIDLALQDKIARMFEGEEVDTVP